MTMISKSTTTDEDFQREARKFGFGPIPPDVLVQLRRDAEELHTPPTSWHHPEDINTLPEIFGEYQEDAEALARYLVDQAQLGLECADGQAVVLEITPDEWTLLHLGGFICHGPTKRNFRPQADGKLYLMTPWGDVQIEVKANEST